MIVYNLFDSAGVYSLVSDDIVFMVRGNLKMKDSCRDKTTWTLPVKTYGAVVWTQVESH